MQKFPEIGLLQDKGHKDFVICSIANYNHNPW